MQCRIRDMWSRVHGGIFPADAMRGHRHSFCKSWRHRMCATIFVKLTVLCSLFDCYLCLSVFIWYASVVTINLLIDPMKRNKYVFILDEKFIWNNICSNGTKKKCSTASECSMSVNILLHHIHNLSIAFFSLFADSWEIVVRREKCISACLFMNFSLNQSRIYSVYVTYDRIIRAWRKPCIDVYYTLSRRQIIHNNYNIIT